MAYRRRPSRILRSGKNSTSEESEEQLPSNSEEEEEERESGSRERITRSTRTVRNTLRNTPRVVEQQRRSIIDESPVRIRINQQEMETPNISRIRNKGTTIANEATEPHENVTPRLPRIRSEDSTTNTLSRVRRNSNISQSETRETTSRQEKSQRQQSDVRTTPRQQNEIKENVISKVDKRVKSPVKITKKKSTKDEFSPIIMRGSPNPLSTNKKLSLNTPIAEERRARTPRRPISIIERQPPLEGSPIDRGGRQSTEAEGSRTKSSIEKTPKREEKAESIVGDRELWCKNLSKDKLEIVRLASSRTNCVVLFARQKNVIVSKEMAVKITLIDTPKNNSFDVERRIYRTIVPELIKGIPPTKDDPGIQGSPHFVEYIDDFVCKDFAQSLKTMALSRDGEIRFNAAEILTRLKNIANNNRRYKNIKDAINDKIHVLFTEKAPGHTVQEWITSSLYEKYFETADRLYFDRNVLLQVAFSLLVMKKWRMKHNDLHCGNAYVEEIPESVMNYKLNDRPYLTRYFTRIFDYDHASVEGKIKNTFLDNNMCAEYGECEEYLDKWDWFTFLDDYASTMILDSKTPNVFWNKWFPDRNRLARGEKFADDVKGNKIGVRSFRGRACICADKDCNRCDIANDMLRRLPSPEEFIKANYPFT